MTQWELPVRFNIYGTNGSGFVMTYRLEHIENFGAYLRITVTYVSHSNTIASSLCGFWKDEHRTAGYFPLMFGYEYDASSTADADPGSGKFRLNAATPDAVTAVYMSFYDINGFYTYPVITQTWLAQWGGSKTAYLYIVQKDVLNLGFGGTYGGYYFTKIEVPGAYLRIPVLFTGGGSTALYDKQVYGFFARPIIQPSGVIVNIGTIPRRSGRVDVTSVAHGFGGDITAEMSATAYPGKGTLGDENEMDDVHWHGVPVGTDTLRFTYHSRTKIKGSFALTIIGYQG
jgi:hypothetical protein